MSLYDLNNFDTDTKKENEGVWEPLGPGARVLVARLGNKAYNEAFKNIPHGVRLQMEAGMIDDEHAEELICNLLSQTVLLNWEGVGEDGKELPYSPENAQKMLLKHKNFRNFIWTLASEQSRFRASEIANSAKNLKTVSSGN